MKRKNLSDILKEEAIRLKAGTYQSLEDSVEWSCPSNIALVKYWGKKPGQIPMNPSLSLSLNKAITRTRMWFRYEPGSGNQELSFVFEGAAQPDFHSRIRKYLNQLQVYLPLLSDTSLRIESNNTFPHSSGIASSASAMGALALCLVSMEQKITRSHPDDPLKHASFLARLGSGSASRSVYPGFVVWGSSDAWPGSDDEYAIQAGGINAVFLGMKDSILVVEKGSKSVSSSAGHQLMETNPFSELRFQQARSNMAVVKEILTVGDWMGLIDLMEEEALSLHAMMMTSRPGYLLMKPATLSIIQKIRDFRKQAGFHLGFTLDAGANVHLIYDTAHEKPVEDFIESDLLQFCENSLVIHDRMGDGPNQSR